MFDHRYTAESITRQARIGCSHTVEHARRCFGASEVGYIFDHKLQQIEESVVTDAFCLCGIESLWYYLQCDPYDDTEVLWLLRVLPLMDATALAAEVYVHPNAEC